MAGLNSIGPVVAVERSWFGRGTGDGGALRLDLLPCAQRVLVDIMGGYLWCGMLCKENDQQLPYPLPTRNQVTMTKNVSTAECAWGQEGRVPTGVRGTQGEEEARAEGSSTSGSPQNLPWIRTSPHPALPPGRLCLLDGPCLHGEVFVF